MKAGFIGLGSLGKAMVKRLVAEGVELVVWNRTAEKAIGLGVEFEETPAMLASRADVIFLSLFDSEAVEAVLADHDGLLEGPCKGKIVVDTTTNQVEAVLRFYGLVAAKGGVYVEAPVLGSVPQAERGELAFLLGADAGAIGSVGPYLEKLARSVFRFEEPGLATKAKLIESLVLGSFMATLGEALGLGEAVGIPRARVLDILTAGSGNSALLTAKKRKLEKEDFSPELASATLHKDLQYLAELAAGLRRPLVDGGSATDLFANAVARGEGALDFSAICKVITRLSTG
jgi:3-hydroxyisobutyrate dehydrogenase